MVRTQIFAMCILLWPWRYDHRSRSWQTLGLWTIVSNIQIQYGSQEYGSDTDYGYGVTVILVLETWPWVKVIASLGIDNTCEILCSYKMACMVKSLVRTRFLCVWALSVRPSSLIFHIFDFFSVTGERNSTKLVMEQDLNVLYQVCVFRADRKTKMTTSTTG